MLTELQLKQVKPRPTQYKLSDARGMYLLVFPNGSKGWRFRYRYGGKEKLISFGVYPEVSLKEAREHLDKARMLLRQGINPSQQRTDRKEALRRDTLAAFSIASEGWFAFKSKSWASETKRKARYILDDYLIPSIGHISVATMSSKDVSGPLLKIAERAPVLARKARQIIAGVIRYSQRDGLRDESRALPLAEILPSYQKGHIPAATSPIEIGRVMKAIYAYPSPVTQSALLMCAYTALRPGVVVSMRWDEIQGDEWHIPAEKMKMRVPHLVSLPKQAMALLETMRPFTAGRDYVFPTLARQKSPHLSRDSLSSALRDMGFRSKHSPHGFRGMLRTAGRERLKIDTDILESQLAHSKKGDVNKAYDRTTFTDDRREAMQKWADYLDELRQG